MSETLSDLPDEPEVEGADTEADGVEAAADTQPQPTAQQPAGKMVPLSELMQERERRRAIEADLQRTRDEFVRGNARLEQLMETVGKIAQPPRQAEQAPDINTDPVGFFKWQAERQEREIAELRAFKQQQEQTGQQRAAEDQFITAYRADAAAFRAKSPDFDPAYEHFMQTVYDMATDAGATPQQARQEVLAQEQRLVRTALQNGRSPAEAVYGAAKRWGFQPPATAQNGAARMEAIQRGQSAAKTTANGGGGGGKWDNITVERLAQMAPEEFARVPVSIVDRVMGKGA